MAPALRPLLLGPDADSSLSIPGWLLPVAVFGVSFAFYAAGLFSVSGGVIWIPGDAALLGLVISLVVGYLGEGVLVAVASVYGAVLGYHADHAFLGLSSHSRFEQLAYFLELDGLAYFGLIALVIGAIGFVLGSLGSTLVGLFGKESKNPQ
jgi:hypothetical protein